MKYFLIKTAILALVSLHMVYAKNIPRFIVENGEHLNETVSGGSSSSDVLNETVSVVSVVNETAVNVDVANQTVEEASPKLELDQPLRKVARYMCPPGYTGNSCEDRDPCFFNGPCGTYGRCVAGYDGSARCECQVGYTGATCQSSDPCSAYPCQNGQCVSQGNSFVCQCTHGYTGQLCENSDGGYGGGSSYNSGGSSYSSGGSGGGSYGGSSGGGSYGGSSGPCYPNPCQNGGQCNMYGSTYTCQCPTGYSGQRCDSYGASSYGGGSGGGGSYPAASYDSAPSYSSGPCYENPCQHGGQCVPYGSTFICQCPPGYSGQKCDSGSGSYSGGGGGGYARDGYSGGYPSGGSGGYPSGGGGGYPSGGGGGYPSGGGGGYASGPCYENPCQNGGQCTPYGSTYVCQCPAGYSGQSCGQSIYSNNNY